MNDDFFDRDGSAKSEVRHGAGVLRLLGGAPDEAVGCLLSNGEMTNAICLAARAGEQVWAWKIGPENKVHRRGRLIIEPGVAVRFIDDAIGDVSAG
jgi:hypothetical protein